MLLLILTFICGAAYELGCVFWVHYSEENNIFPAVCWSMFNALVTVIGLGEALHKLLFIIIYMCGFGFGTYMALRFKKRLVGELDMEVISLDKPMFFDEITPNIKFIDFMICKQLFDPTFFNIKKIIFLNADRLIIIEAIKEKEKSAASFYVHPDIKMLNFMSMHKILHKAIKLYIMQSNLYENIKSSDIFLIACLLGSR